MTQKAKQMWRRLSDQLISKELWTVQFRRAWIVSVLSFILFDVVWCGATTFRAMSFVPTWLFALLAGTLTSMPTALAPRHRWLQLMVWLVIDCVFIANLLYFRTYFTAIPASSYLLAGNLADFKTSVTDSLRVVDVVFPALTAAGYLWLCKAGRERQSKGRYFVTLAVIAMAAALSSLPYGGPVKHIKDLTQKCYYVNCPPAVYTIAGKVAADMIGTSERITAEERQTVETWMARHRKLCSEPLDSVAKGRNVVMIFLESVETWPLEKRVEGIEVTPTLNRLISDTTTFYAPNITTQVGNGRSIDAQLLLLAGMLPMQNEVYAMGRTDNTYLTLIKALKEATPGMRATLLTGDKATVWNQVNVARAFGIDTILDASSWEITEKIGNPPKLSDRALFEQIAARCRAGELMPEGEPFFMQIVAYSTHNPFVIPEEYRKATFAKDGMPAKFNDYLTAVNYVDSALGAFIDYLKSRSDWENTVVVIVGDHEGLAVYRDEMTAHPVAGKIVDPGRHTPLIVLNSPRPGRYEGEAGQVDVYTTLLDLLGLGKYGWHGLGHTFAPGRKHVGAAVESDGRMTGDQLTDADRSADLNGARRVSDIMLRFNLQDSISRNGR